MSHKTMGSSVLLNAQMQTKIPIARMAPNTYSPQTRAMIISPAGTLKIYPHKGSYMQVNAYYSIPVIGRNKKMMMTSKPVLLMFRVVP